ncbi:LemA protein [Alteribacillus persepolensis]|uniref:LemA protein n=1 Tax=Alteribacillus persepolensis TaxID=568899 RepID=A0A1G8DBA1_9BACI|nr:LemA family protein [Alteribacillus persepolensis]SDH55078.1 LemA protein [Alteribacillus persepolensis]
MTLFGAILGIVIIIAIVSWIIGYNSLIKYLNWVEESWAEIDAQLQQRMEIIPSFIDIVQPHVRYEQQTLERIVELRSQLASPNDNRHHQLDINQELSEALEHILSLDEIPELRKDQAFRSLEKKVNETDAKIQKAVKMYNNTVDKYNTKIQSPPTRFVANIHNFYKRNTINMSGKQNRSIKMPS